MNCAQFFKDLNRDLDIVTKGELNADVHKVRCTSVELRIYGLAVTILSAFGAAIGLSVFIAYPILGLNCLGTAALGIAIGHDFMQMGVNASRLISITNPIYKNKGLWDSIAQVAQGMFYVFKGGFQGEDAYLLDGTWLFKSIYELSKD